MSRSTWISRARELREALVFRGVLPGGGLSAAAVELGAQEPAAAGQGADGEEQVGLQRVLEDVAAHAGGQRVPHILRIVEHAEDHDRPVRPAPQDLDGRVEAVDLRHRHVEHDHVGVELLVEGDGFGAAARLADDFDVLLVFEDAAESLPHERVIVGEQYANRHRQATSDAAGARHPRTRSCTTVPPPCAGDTCSSPPINSARSRMLTIPMPRGASPAGGAAAMPLP